MGLDAHVRCRCIQDGLAKPHPFQSKLILDETLEPVLGQEASEEQWAMLNRWFADSCEHNGYLSCERLGNISLIKHIRELVRYLQSNPGPRFPILLESVIYDGTHCGDCLSSSQARELLEEVNVVLQSSDILSELEETFSRACADCARQASKTGNPIVF